MLGVARTELALTRYLINELRSRARTGTRRCATSYRGRAARLGDGHGGPAGPGHQARPGDRSRRAAVRHRAGRRRRRHRGRTAGRLPGASTAVSAMLTLLERCFPDRMPAWRPALQEAIPSYGRSLATDPALLAEVRAPRCRRWSSTADPAQTGPVVPPRDPGAAACRPAISRPSRASPSAAPFWDDAEVVLAPEDPRPGAWVGGAVGPAGRRHVVAGLPAAPPRRRGPRRRQRRRPLRRRRAVHAGRRDRQGELRRRVAGAPGARAHARRPVAALRQLRDAGHQALAGGPPRGRHRRGPRDRDAADRAARQRDRRRQGPGDPARRASVAPLGVGAPARGPRRDRPDDHRARHQPRRRRVDVAGHRPGRHPGQLGRPRRPVRHRRARRAALLGALRRPRHRGGELGGAHRPGGRRTASGGFVAVGDAAPAAEPARAVRPALRRRRRAARRRRPLVLRGHPARRRPRAAHGARPRLTRCPVGDAGLELTG